MRIRIIPKNCTEIRARCFDSRVSKFISDYLTQRLPVTGSLTPGFVFPPNITDSLPFAGVFYPIDGDGRYVSVCRNTGGRITQVVTHYFASLRVSTRFVLVSFVQIRQFFVCSLTASLFSFGSHLVLLVT